MLPQHDKKYDLQVHQFNVILSVNDSFNLETKLKKQWKEISQKWLCQKYYGQMLWVLLLCFSVSRYFCAEIIWFNKTVSR